MMSSMFHCFVRKCKSRAFLFYHRYDYSSPGSLDQSSESKGPVTKTGEMPTYMNTQQIDEQVLAALQAEAEHVTKGMAATARENPPTDLFDMSKSFMAFNGYTLCEEGRLNHFLYTFGPTSAIKCNITQLTALVAESTIFTCKNLLHKILFGNQFVRVLGVFFNQGSIQPESLHPPPTHPSLHSTN